MIKYVVVFLAAAVPVTSIGVWRLVQAPPSTTTTASSPEAIRAAEDAHSRAQAASAENGTWDSTDWQDPLGLSDDASEPVGEDELTTARRQFASIRNAVSQYISIARNEKATELAGLKQFTELVESDEAMAKQFRPVLKRANERIAVLRDAQNVNDERLERYTSALQAYSADTSKRVSAQKLIADGKRILAMIEFLKQSNALDDATAKQGADKVAATVSAWLKQHMAPPAVTGDALPDAVRDCDRDYQAQWTKVESNISNEAAWREMFVKCRELNRQLDTIRKQAGDAPSYSLVRHEAFAKGVLANWDDFAKLLSK